ncbi:MULTISPECIES: hypothetical protein [Agrobacterium]|uniref:hypothetical protein n=2 Tax=Rhizobium/Agrobacterium group TaxID=227290 RepID=UPI00307EA14C
MVGLSGRRIFMLHDITIRETAIAPVFPLRWIIDAGKLPALPDSIGMGDVINGQKSGRETPDDRIIFIACGMAVFDISWGYQLYQNAIGKGIGETLNLWERPHQG